MTHFTISPLDYFSISLFLHINTVTLHHCTIQITVLFSYHFFTYNIPLIATDGGVAWIGLGIICYMYLDSLSGSTLGGGTVWFSVLGSLELFFIRGAGVVGSASMFGILVSASKILSNYLIALSWEFPTWKCDSGLGFFKVFVISAASWMAIYLEL